MADSIPAELVRDLQRDLARAREFADYWAQNALPLMRSYGGQWVAFRGTTVVTHGRSAQALEKKLKDAGEDPAMLSVRYVPRATDRYVLFR